MWKQHYSDEKGITLVELLAALSIFSIVVLLIGSVHMFGQRQYQQQSDRIEVSSDVRLVMAQFESDMRSVGSGSVYWEDDTFFINNNQEESISYRLSNNEVFRNDSSFAQNIQTFLIEHDSSANPESVTLTITGVQKTDRQPQTLTTTIYMRRGD